MQPRDRSNNCNPLSQKDVLQRETRMNQFSLIMKIVETECNLLHDLFSVQMVELISEASSFVAVLNHKQAFVFDEALVNLQDVRVVEGSDH